MYKCRDYLPNINLYPDIQCLLPINSYLSKKLVQRIENKIKKLLSSFSFRTTTYLVYTSCKIKFSYAIILHLSANILLPKVADKDNVHKNRKKKLDDVL